jgi:hypothetical protein
MTIMDDLSGLDGTLMVFSSFFFFVLFPLLSVCSFSTSTVGQVHIKNGRQVGRATACFFSTKTAFGHIYHLCCIDIPRPEGLV